MVGVPSAHGLRVPARRRTPPPAIPLEVIEDPGNVTIVRFLMSEILDAEAAVAIGKLLLPLAERDRPRLVLNLASVRAINSTLLGKLFTLYRNVKAAGGGLALCGVQPNLMKTFRVVKLTDRVSLYGEEREAVQALWAAA